MNNKTFMDVLYYRNIPKRSNNWLKLHGYKTRRGSVNASYKQVKKLITASKFVRKSRRAIYDKYSSRFNSSITIDSIYTMEREMRRIRLTDQNK